MVNNDELRNELVIPKGTRVKIQGCPFYLAEDAKIEGQDDESKKILDGVLAEEKAYMEYRKTGNKSKSHSSAGKHPRQV